MERFDDGILYALELDQIDVDDPWDGIEWGRRYLGYFYVTNDSIYNWAATMDGFTEESNQEAIRMLREDEEAFLGTRYIVCSENGTEDIVDELGYHAFVEVDGDRRIFRYYNDYYYGTKGYRFDNKERNPMEQYELERIKPIQDFLVDEKDRLLAERLGKIGGMIRDNVENIRGKLVENENG